MSITNPFIPQHLLCSWILILLSFFIMSSYRNFIFTKWLRGAYSIKSRSLGKSNNLLGYKILTSHSLSFNPLTIGYTGSSLRHTGFSSWGAWAQFPQSIWAFSSPTRHQTCVPCIGRQLLNHQATREVPNPLPIKPLFSGF